jgi:hypothetical protein
MKRAAMAVCLAALAGPMLGWNAHGHRLVTKMALDGLTPEAPSWLREEEVRARIADQSNEADRWRGTKAAVLNHVEHTNHYLDVEDLEQFGLTLQTVPRLRYEYVKAMVMAKVEFPEKILPYDAARDPDRSKEWPGFALHAVDEHLAKLTASFSTMRILEELNDPARAHALKQARENVIHEMGMLSHMVGDLAQPLHTTRHHHGWVGPNPNGYTTAGGIHSYIDGGVLAKHGLTYEGLKGRRADVRVNAGDPWKDVVAYVQRSFDKVEPLYQLQKSGDLDREPGKEFISERLTDAGGMLAALYNAAWERSTPDRNAVASYVRFSEERETTPAK